jgi:TolB-like protein
MRLPSVAVLPFETIGGDASAVRLAVGLSEDIIIDLARFPKFEVIGSNSSAVYTDAREAGEELGAAFVVAGSIQREAMQIRIAARLADAEKPDAATGMRHIRSEWRLSVERCYGETLWLSKSPCLQKGRTRPRC